MRASRSGRRARRGGGTFLATLGGARSSCRWPCRNCGHCCSHLLPGRRYPSRRLAAADDELCFPALRPLRAERAHSGRRPGIALVDPLGLAEPTFVPDALLPLLQHFDGATDAPTIATRAG